MKTQSDPYLTPTISLTTSDLLLLRDCKEITGIAIQIKIDDEAQEFLKGIFISKAEFELIKQKAYFIENILCRSICVIGDLPVGMTDARTPAKELNSILAQVEGAVIRSLEKGRKEMTPQELIDILQKLCDSGKANNNTGSVYIIFEGAHRLVKVDNVGADQDKDIIIEPSETEADIYILE